MKKYFTLYSTTHFLYSKDKGCLYNTLNGNVISLDKRQKDLLVFSENGNKINELSKDELDFYDNLEKNLLGTYGDKTVTIEPTFWGENSFFSKVSGNKRNFEVLQIELTGECNYNCVFCDKNSDLIYRKTGCKRWKTNCNDKKLNIKEWKKYIGEAFKLGCKKIQIFGGEPLLQWDLLKEIINISYNIGIEKIEVYTNGSLLNKDKLLFISEQKIKLIIQISNIDNNKEILGIDIDMDYEKIINLLKIYNIEFEILVLISKYNEQYVNEYIKKIKMLQCKYKIDFIYPFPENKHFSKQYMNLVLDYRKKLIKVNPINFGLVMLKNPCYSRIIAISQYGIVYPCIMSRFMAYGKLNGENCIVDILNYKYEDLKELNKSRMYSCKECVFRFACVNCSAIEISASNGLYSCKNCSLIEE